MSVESVMPSNHLILCHPLPHLPSIFPHIRVFSNELASSDHGLPWWLRWERIWLQCGRPGFDPWIGKIPWRTAWQPTPVFLPGESPWTEKPGGYLAGKEFDTTEWLSTAPHTSSDQSIGASASASVLSMNIQGWFSLGLTALISLFYRICFITFLAFPLSIFMLLHFKIDCRQQYMSSKYFSICIIQYLRFILLI